MKKFLALAFVALALPSLAFIGGGGGNSGTADFANEAFHAETIDNAFGSNVVVSGTCDFTNSTFAGVGVFGNPALRLYNGVTINSDINMEFPLLINAAGLAGSTALSVDIAGNSIFGYSLSGSITLDGPGGITDNGGGGITTSGIFAGDGSGLVNLPRSIGDGVGEGMAVTGTGLGYWHIGPSLSGGLFATTNNGDLWATDYHGNGNQITFLNPANLSAGDMAVSGNLSVIGGGTITGLGTGITQLGETNIASLPLGISPVNGWGKDYWFQQFGAAQGYNNNNNNYATFAGIVLSFNGGIVIGANTNGGVMSFAVPQTMINNKTVIINKLYLVTTNQGLNSLAAQFNQYYIANATMQSHSVIGSYSYITPPVGTNMFTVTITNQILSQVTNSIASYFLLVQTNSSSFMCIGIESWTH